MLKEEAYEMILRQLDALIEGETNVIANLANTTALLNQALEDINWVGFYLLEGNTLVLGPFQGKVACIRIPIGKGVCGSAVAEKTIKCVANVHDFPGHIACDCASNSEIVIPIKVGNEVVGVLDIDSPIIGRFDEIDSKYLVECVNLIEKQCDWSKRTP